MYDFNLYDRLEIEEIGGEVLQLEDDLSWVEDEQFNATLAAKKLVKIFGDLRDHSRGLIAEGNKRLAEWEELEKLPPLEAARILASGFVRGGEHADNLGIPSPELWSKINEEERVAGREITDWEAEWEAWHEEQLSPSYGLTTPTFGEHEF
jgi:hypothetical protein